MDKNDTGWKPGAASSEIIEISIDEANRKLYAVNAYQGIGYRPFQCVVKIDMDSWTIDTYWDTSTTPAFSTYFTGNIFMNANRHHGERYYTIVARSAVVDGDMVLAVLNADANTITHYVFLNKPPYSLTKNVDWTPWNPYGSSFYFVWSIWGSHIDFASSRLYIFLRFVIANYCLFDVGYIDLTDPGPTYTYNNILQSTNEIHYLIGQCIRCFKVFPDDGIFIISAGYQGAGRIGYILIYALSSGSLLKKYTVGTHPTCPYWGISNPCMRGGKIYASFTYESGYGQANYRGICEIDINTDTFTYHRPTWATLDDYELRASAVTDDDRIIFSTYGYGMTIFDPDTGVWILYDSTTLPGLSPTGADNYIPVKYDSTTAMVYTGAYGSWDGLVGFSIYGFLKRTYYKIGTFAVSWSFGSANPLVLGQIDYDSVIALDPSDQSIYAFWTNKTLLEFSIKWDKESPSFDLTPYVLRSEEIVTEKSIDGTPNKLIFGLSHGHLFDKYNTNSLLRIYLLKGRALDVRQGENISSVEYWQALGRFYVSETSISGYERGKYPTMRVNAEDIRTIWDDMEIITSEFYENYPETVLNSILTNYADLTGGDLDIPTMDNRVFIYRQYLDTSIADMVKEICDRFGYYPRITVDDKFSCRRISDSNSIDHTYSDLDQIINFSPDDSYSSYINQITIVGEERDFNTIIYPEEPVGYINGTVGWWGHKCDYWVWFSEDHTKKCESPRLEIVESARKILFELAGTITEQIEYIDPNGLYCIVKVDVPDMTWMLLTLLNYYLYYAIYEPDGVVGGVTVPYGRLIEGATLFAMIYILASVTNFQYVVHATPIGEERRTVQATADDTDFQNELGKVVQKRIEDPLCTTQAQCQTVATQEMMEVRLQRNRVRFSKTAHLQEEEGDTIKINHPITGYPMTVFITNLKRRMKLPEGPKGSGHWIDDIEGWKVA